MGLATVARILQKEVRQPGRIVVVVSAMGKTTNALEAILETACRKEDFKPGLQRLLTAHLETARQVTPDSAELANQLADLGQTAKRDLEDAHKLPFDEAYDQIVSMGELLSSRLLHQVLLGRLPSVAWLDARTLIKTDSTFRTPQVDIQLTNDRIYQAVLQSNAQVLVVQGFIGSDAKDRTTTLGREGSDYTAALLGGVLQAESVTVWKDVPGILNADPRRLPNAHLLPRMSYADAAEMTFYGATVLHPKTLKPLAEAGIPLYVRSFVQPDSAGTYIGPEAGTSTANNIYLQVDGMALLSCRTLDLSFITELHVAKVVSAANEAGLRVLMLQTSALELQLAVPQDFRRAAHLAQLLDMDYTVTARYELALATFIRADHAFVETILLGRKAIIRQCTEQAELVLTTA